MLALIPPVPAWEVAHPIIVHLPIGTLAVAPLLGVWAMLAGKSRRALGGATLLVLAVGAAGLVLAAASGEAAEEAAVIPGLASKVLGEHEEAGALARNVFLGIGAGYAVLVGLAAMLGDRLKRWAWVAGHVAWLLAMGVGLVLLMNAGHLGGRLVHELGVRAPMGPGGVGVIRPEE